MSQTRIRLTRADLYEKVWATPMRILAEEFGMSDVGLAKVCRKHNVPVPPVGYWRRKETGYKVTRPLLPVAKDAAEHLDIYVRERLRQVTDSLAHVLTPAEAKHPWSAPKHDYKLTGRLQLQISNLPAFMGPIRRTWADGKQQRIEDCIGDFIIGLSVAAAAINKHKQEMEEREQRWAEERKQEEDERRKAEEHKRKAEFVTELIGNWEEAVRLRQFIRAIEERTSQSDFSDDEKGDIQQVADWTREYADSLDPLSDLPDAIDEFVRPESTYGWLR